MSLQHDPVENTTEFQHVIEAARGEVREQLLAEGFDTEKMWGGCHMFWPALNEHLKEKYGIDWQTPAEMNAGVLFD